MSSLTSVLTATLCPSSCPGKHGGGTVPCAVTALCWEDRLPFGEEALSVAESWARGGVTPDQVHRSQVPPLPSAASPLPVCPLHAFPASLLCPCSCRSSFPYVIPHTHTYAGPRQAVFSETSWGSPSLWRPGSLVLQPWDSSPLCFSLIISERWRCFPNLPVKTPEAGLSFSSLAP